MHVKTAAKLLCVTVVPWLLLGSQPAAGQTKGSDEVERGKRLYKSLNCGLCHNVDSAGGCMGPPLGGVSQRRSAKYLTARLGENKEAEFVELVKHPELFPHPRFKPRDVSVLLAYLQTLGKVTSKPIDRHAVSKTVTDDAPAVALVGPGLSAASSREGRRLFSEMGCLACHSVNGAGGSLAPSLNGVGSRRQRRYIEAHISDPAGHFKSKKRTSKMTDPGLFPAEVRNITDFLLSLPPDQ